MDCSGALQVVARRHVHFHRGQLAASAAAVPTLQLALNPLAHLPFVLLLLCRAGHLLNGSGVDWTDPPLVIELGVGSAVVEELTNETDQLPFNALDDDSRADIVAETGKSVPHWRSVKLASMQADFAADQSEEGNLQKSGGVDAAGTQSAGAASDSAAAAGKPSSGLLTEAERARRVVLDTIDTLISRDHALIQQLWDDYRAADDEELRLSKLYALIDVSFHVRTSCCAESHHQADSLSSASRSVFAPGAGGALCTEGARDLPFPSSQPQHPPRS